MEGGEEKWGGRGMRNFRKGGEGRREGKRMKKGEKGEGIERELRNREGQKEG